MKHMSPLEGGGQETSPVGPPGGRQNLNAVALLDNLALPGGRQYGLGVNVSQQTSQ